MWGLFNRGATSENETTEVIDAGELTFDEAGLETPAEFIGYEGSLVVKLPSYLKLVTDIGGIDEDTRLANTFPDTPDFMTQPYCPTGYVQIYPEGEQPRQYRVLDKRNGDA
ncbi:hypothetical protein [Natrinema soli]|uniref:Uncharacterized protein n=1 Tax=Natrinema soli TaxID=1930624 RepID=A0ABD5SUK9_9EURY|nr:hypothetical protein [Natrinema soli]